MTNQSKAITRRTSESGQTTISRTKTVRNHQAGCLPGVFFTADLVRPNASLQGNSRRAKWRFKAPHQMGVDV